MLTVIDTTYGKVYNTFTIRSIQGVLRQIWLDIYYVHAMLNDFPCFYTYFGGHV